MGTLAWDELYVCGKVILIKETGELVGFVREPFEESAGGDPFGYVDVPAADVADAGLEGKDNGGGGAQMDDAGADCDDVTREIVDTLAREEAEEEAELLEMAYLDEEERGAALVADEEEAAVAARVASMDAAAPAVQQDHDCERAQDYTPASGISADGRARRRGGKAEVGLGDARHLADELAEAEEEAPREEGAELEELVPEEEAEEMGDDAGGEDGTNGTGGGRGRSTKERASHALQFQFYDHTSGVVVNLPFLFTSTMTSHELYDLVLLVMYDLYQCGVRVRNLVCDAGGPNKGLVNILFGEKIKEEMRRRGCSNLVARSYVEYEFKNPYDGEPVTMQLDGPHVLKSSRTRLFLRPCWLFDADGNLVAQPAHWRDIVALSERQHTTDGPFCTDSPLNLRGRAVQPVGAAKMCVRLALNVMNLIVATHLDHAGKATTAEFVRQLATVFDTMFGGAIYRSTYEQRVVRPINDFVVWLREQTEHAEAWVADKKRNVQRLSLQEVFFHRITIENLFCSLKGYARAVANHFSSEETAVHKLMPCSMLTSRLERSFLAARCAPGCAETNAVSYVAYAAHMHKTMLSSSLHQSYRQIKAGGNAYLAGEEDSDPAASAARPGGRPSPRPGAVGDMRPLLALGGVRSTAASVRAQREEYARKVVAAAVPGSEGVLKGTALDDALVVPSSLGNMPGAERRTPRLVVGPCPCDPSVRRLYSSYEETVGAAVLRGDDAFREEDVCRALVASVVEQDLSLSSWLLPRLPTTGRRGAGAGGRRRGRQRPAARAARQAAAGRGGRGRHSRRVRAPALARRRRRRPCA